ncbi:energy transducer TonB [Myxococcota bacterium]|nr:energy transducer TonB [Myxococcota bacterium]
MAAARMLVAFGLAWIVTFALFYLMQGLIGVEGQLDQSKAPKVVDFVRVIKSEVVKQKSREAPKKVALDDTPPPPDMSTDSSTSLDADSIGVAAVIEEASSGEGGGGGLGVMTADGEAVPLVRVPPQYPERASQKGLEGRVLVQFTITKSGSVRDPKVIASEPPGVFDQAAVKAVLQWKYNPKIVNGKAVEQPGVKVAFPFKLDQATS